MTETISEVVAALKFVAGELRTLQDSVQTALARLAPEDFHQEDSRTARREWGHLQIDTRKKLMALLRAVSITQRDAQHLGEKVSWLFIKPLMERTWDIGKRQYRRGPLPDEITQVEAVLKAFDPRAFDWSRLKLGPITKARLEVALQKTEVRDDG